MNGADEAAHALTANSSYGFAVSQFIGPLFFSYFGIFRGTIGQ
jgi:hypothetical protein